MRVQTKILDNLSSDEIEDQSNAATSEIENKGGKISDIAVQPKKDSALWIVAIVYTIPDALHSTDASIRARELLESSTDIAIEDETL